MLTANSLFLISRFKFTNNRYKEATSHWYSSAQTTQIHAKISNQKVNEDMKILSNRIENRYELPKNNMPIFHHNQYSLDKITGDMKYIKKINVF